MINRHPNDSTGRGVRRRALLVLLIVAMGIGLVIALRAKLPPPRTDRADSAGPPRERPIVNPRNGSEGGDSGTRAADAARRTSSVIDRAAFRLLTPDGEPAAGARAKLVRRTEAVEFSLEPITDIATSDENGIVRLRHPDPLAPRAYLEAAWLLPEENGVHSGLWPLRDIAIVDGMQEVRFRRGGSLTVRAEGLDPGVFVPIQLVFFAPSSRFRELFEDGEPHHAYGPRDLRGDGSWTGLRSTVGPGAVAAFPALSTGYAHILRTTPPEGYYLVASDYTGRRMSGRGYNPVFRVSAGVDETLTLVYRRLPDLVIEFDGRGGMPTSATLIYGYSFWDQRRIAGRRSCPFENGVARVRMAAPGPNVTAGQLHQSRYVAIIRAEGFAARIIDLDYELGSKEVRRIVRLQPAAEARPLVIRGRVETKIGLPVAFLRLRVTDENHLVPLDLKTGADGTWNVEVGGADAPLFRWGRALHAELATGTKAAEEIRIAGKSALVRRLGDWTSEVAGDATSVDVLLRVGKLTQPEEN